jgi:hypothetical protein
VGELTENDKPNACKSAIGRHDPEKVLDDPRADHDGNDKSQRWSYVCRRFRSEIERLENSLVTYAKTAAEIRAT